MNKIKLSPAKHELLDKWLSGQLTEDITNIPQHPPDSPIPLSFPQQRQLFLELLEPGTAVNNLSVCLELIGNLDIVALEQSANQIIARHDVLRTHFSFDQGLPTPNFLSDLIITIPTVNLKELDVIKQMTKVRRLVEEEALQPFDLSHAPLMRLKLYELSDKKHFLLVIVHHTLADGWSLGLFLKELAMFYQKITIGKSTNLNELPIQYADFAHWQTSEARGEVLQSELLYWKKQLSGELPILELPTDQQRSARQSFNGGTHHFVISSDLTEALEKINQEDGVTMFMSLLTVFYILLHRYTEQDKIIVGTPIANRNLPELENLIGVFINTLVLRTSLSGDPSFRELLKRVRDVSLEAYAHQDLPFEKLVEELKPVRDLSRTPLFQVVFNMQNSPMPRLEIPGLGINPLEIDRGVSQFDLTLMISNTEGQYRGTVEYNRYLFEAASISRMFQSFQMLLEDVIAQPDCQISQLKLITDDEQNLLVNKLNQTQFDFPREKCFHQLFEEQVEQTPDAVAIIHDNVSISYSELNQRANVLARHLRSLGIGQDVRVGIFMEKSLEIVEALLGVLKAGWTYVPIHTSFPAERIKFILDDANVKVLLTNVVLKPLKKLKLHVVDLNDNKLSANSITSNPDNIVSSDNLAYIIYTSGSTGRPKGVMVQHSALMNFLWSMSFRPGMNKSDILIAVTSISFDIAALELFLPLIVGATIVIASEEITTNPYLLDQAINRHHVTIMQATPATWQMLLESDWTSELRLKALCGGDVLTRKMADKLLENVGSLWNMYGPTETTVWSSISQVEHGDTQITIGQPINNTQIYILDRNLQPVPIGVIGELHIGGDGLAQGYINNPQLTNEKFIADCFRSIEGARLYKTGDHARYLPDYSTEVLGRIDDQVKIHGYRIELGEISAMIMQHSLVTESIVIIRTENSGEKRLVAYFISKQDESPNIRELKEFIRKKLPSYMIPAIFIQLNCWPLTPNGKINRTALPVPEDVRPQQDYTPPRNEEEQIMVNIWQNVLDIEQVGIHDNFFDLGGASIQSLRIVAKANIAGFRFSPETIFEYQTIAEVVAQIKRKA